MIATFVIALQAITTVNAVPEASTASAPYMDCLSGHIDRYPAQDLREKHEAIFQSAVTECSSEKRKAIAVIEALASTNASRDASGADYAEDYLGSIETFIRDGLPLADPEEPAQETTINVAD